MSAVHYSGRPGNNPGNVMVHEGFRDTTLSHDVRHSPDGFSWGYGGSGPAELARCLLLDATGTDTGYQQFKFDVVARWPMDEGWTYTREQVRAWQKAYLEVMAR
jgi:hypothetical protein